MIGYDASSDMEFSACTSANDSMETWSGVNRWRVLGIDQRETGDNQERVHRGRGLVQRWSCAYRDGGIEALRDKLRGGSKPKLPREQEVAFKARIEAGPRPEDGCARFAARMPSAS